MSLHLYEQEIIADELAGLDIDTRSNAEKNKKRVVSTSVEAYDPNAIPVEEAAPPSDNPEGSIAADTGETPEAPAESNEAGEAPEGNSGEESGEGGEGNSEASEDRDEPSGGEEGDLLYEFNVSRQDDGTYSSR